MRGRSYTKEPFVPEVLRCAQDDVVRGHCVMHETDKVLPYAQPQPRLPRPPMYAIVLSVLCATFLIGFGTFLGVTVVLSVIAKSRDDARLLLAAFLGITAIVFVAVGGLNLRRTIAALRGKPLREIRWEKWLDYPLGVSRWK